MIWILKIIISKNKNNLNKYEINLKFDESKLSFNNFLGKTNVNSITENNFEKISKYF